MSECFMFLKESVIDSLIHCVFVREWVRRKEGLCVSWGVNVYE